MARFSETHIPTREISLDVFGETYAVRQNARLLASNIDRFIAGLLVAIENKLTQVQTQSRCFSRDQEPSSAAERPGPPAPTVCQLRLEEETDEEPIVIAVTVLAHGFDEVGYLGGVK